MPSSDDSDDPRGAAGARFFSTPSSQGTPFVTTDRWTITVEQIALAALVWTIDPQDGEKVGSTLVVWNGARDEETYVPSLLVGALGVQAAPEGFYLDPSGDVTVDQEIHKAIAASGLAPDIEARFLQAPDNANATLADGSAAPRQGPAIVFAVRAEKAGRTVRVPLALVSAFLPSSNDNAGDGIEPLTVRKNAVSYGVYEVHPERIFAVSPGDPTTVFEPLALADADGDGVVTGAELAAVPLPAAAASVDAGDDGGIVIDAEPPACSASVGFDVSSFACVTLLDRVADNAQRVLVPVPTTP